MATYAIGDVQGCFRTLERLLARIQFDPAHDRLWMVGDLVNRGPASLEALRWARAQGDRLTLVLGNHELYLLARARGLSDRRPGDSLDAVLAAPDREDLLDWLAARPLMHREGTWMVVHAGLLPAWSGDSALRLAEETSRLLRGADGADLLRQRRDPVPSWPEGLTLLDRARAALAAFTRLRTCTADGRMCLDHDGPPDTAPPGCLPWFSIPGRRSADHTVIFGHWAALGLYVKDGVAGLDSGCSWGRSLTALRLEDRAIFQEPLADRIPKMG